MLIYSFAIGNEKEIMKDNIMKLRDFFCIKLQLYSLIAIICLGFWQYIPIHVKAEEAVVNIYSYRQPHLIKELRDDFTRKTGIKTNLVFSKKGLAERMAIEGKKSPVDILLSTDIGLLAKAARDSGQAISQAELPELYTHIPPHLRDPNAKWFALTQRARIIYAAKDRVKKDVLYYEDLAQPQWKGRICVRNGQHVYNLGLFASSIIHNGVEQTKQWLQDIKTNLAHKPSGNDRAQIKSIYAKKCDVAIGNTYYMGLMQNNIKNPEQQKWAQNVRLIFARFKNGGTHVNISGVMLARYAPHRKAAIQFIRYLVSKEAQRIYAKRNHEYPVRKDVLASDTVLSWGNIQPDDISLNDIAKTIRQASKLVDETRFNH